MCVGGIQVGGCAVHVKAPGEVWRTSLQRKYIPHPAIRKHLSICRLSESKELEVTECGPYVDQSHMSFCVHDLGFGCMLQVGKAVLTFRVLLNQIKAKHRTWQSLRGSSLLKD